jgi:hypothetical protein
MKAIDIFKLPLTEDTRHYFLNCINSDDEYDEEGRLLDIFTVLDEGLCENTEYTYLGKVDDKIYFCWPEDEIGDVPISDCVEDIQEPLKDEGYIPSDANICLLVEDIEIDDYWK